MRFLIDFHSTVSEQDIQSYLQQQNITVIRNFNKFDKIYLVESPTEPIITEIVEFCFNDEENHISLLNTTVIFDQNYGVNTLTGDVVEISTQDTNDWWKLYSLRNPDLTVELNSIDRRGENTTVYVLDSGINTTHPEFEEANVSNLWSFVDDVSDANDDNGHGTAIASVIAGRSCGITNATVKGVKIFKKGVATKQSDLIHALDMIFQDWEAGAVHSSNRASIVNCSWSIDRNQYIEAKIQQMIDAGMLFVCAAGNNGTPIENVTPAAMRDVLTVGAYNSDFNPCSFSDYTGTSCISVTSNDVNHGALDGWAPGENIKAAVYNSNSFAQASGTSIAAAVHTAILAYNFSWHGIELLSIYSPVEFMSNGGFFRTGLLNLSDPKYVNSVNKISTIVIGFANDSVNHNFFTKAPSKGIQLLNVFNPIVFEKVDILAELPSGITMTNYGRIYGNAPDIDDIVEDYKLDVIPLRATMRNGEIHEYELELLTYKAHLNPKEMQTDDPDLNIKLSVDLCPYQPCNFGGCFDVCVVPNTCNYSSYDPSCYFKYRCVCPD